MKSFLAALLPQSPWLRLAAPLVVVSVMLFGIGVAAAWNVQRQQITASEVIASEMQGVITSHELYVVIREVRHLLNQYFRTSDPVPLAKINQLHQDSTRLLSELGKIVQTPEELEAYQTILRGHEHFFDQYDPIAKNHTWAEQRQLLEHLVDHTISEEILDPAHRFVELSKEVIHRTNQANRRTTDQLRQGFLLLGASGGAAGVIIGLIIARSLERSFLELHVSVSGAAGKLQEIVGQVRLPASSGFNDLQSNLREMESHISDVVQRLQDRELEVLRNEQLAAVGQLAAGVAHEMRNPLQPMKMLVEASMEENGAGLSGRRLSVLHEGILRLEESIQAFLDFARPPALDPQVCDLRQIVGETFVLLSARAERQQIELLSDLPGEPALIKGDLTQLKQVLVNLVLNALDETPEGGKITVRVKSRYAPHCWELIVRDSGPGFPPEIVAKLFDPFVTTKDTGTGLGLTICRRIVEAHGGQIFAENASDGGALFRVRIPSHSRPRLDDSASSVGAAPSEAS